MATRIVMVLALVTAASVLPNAWTAGAQVPTPLQARQAQQTAATQATGDVKRGKELFEKTYRCYACHGFDGQTGSPRLVPMNRTQDAFITYVRKPSTETMPKFAAVPERDLTDVYAYIRSIPVAAQPVDSIPLLKEVLERRGKDR